MNINQKEVLKRYLMNANKFLWGISRRNQKETYPWLRRTGKYLWGDNFDFTNGNYGQVSRQLVVNPGIEQIVMDLIVPEVKKLFQEQAINFLREFWLMGEYPRYSFVEKYGLYNSKYRTVDTDPFLNVNIQYKYVEGWTDFAGLWFEIIEPWINETS